MVDHSKTYILRASLLSTNADPVDNPHAVLAEEDGALLIEDGFIADVGKATAILDRHSACPVIDRRGCIALPGFIDIHVHYPQAGMIASHGATLLDWLERYTFPEEAQFGDADYAATVADIFLDELLNNGTTSALVFGSVHEGATHQLFRAAEARNMRLIAGKALMDRNVPASVRDVDGAGLFETRRLIEAWHGKNRLGYAVSPRFAASCTPGQLKAAAQILNEYPDLLMQTHLSENLDEIAWIKELFPAADTYLAAYSDYGLLNDRSVFAHGIHLEEAEVKALAKAGAAISFCPTSNLFLGSGLFDLKRCKQAGITVGLGTDVGAGTSFSILTTISEAYKVTHLQGTVLDPIEGLYHATLAGAKALHIDDKVGSMQIGKEADFVVLGKAPTPFLNWRLTKAKSLQDRLFIYQMMGDDRAIAETYLMGQPVKTTPPRLP